MSVVFARDDQFLDVPLVTVRNILRAWRYGKSEDAYDIAVRKDVSLDTRTVTILLDELRDRGLIGLEEEEGRKPFDGITEAGRALVAAKGTKRVSKHKALAVLSTFLDRCAAVNARNDLPFCVEQVWLFGSLIDQNKTDVADIDIVPVFGRAARYNQDEEEERYHELAKEFGGDDILENAGIFRDSQLARYVKSQLLYGSRRHHLLAPNNIRDLLNLGCPCKLIFDKSRGGAVDGPALPKHPDSPGRSNHIGAALTMPDLHTGRQPLRPLPANLTQMSRWFSYRSLKDTGPWPAADCSYRWVQDRQGGVVVLTGGGEEQQELRSNVVMSRLNPSNLDARNRCCFLVCDRKYPRPGDYAARAMYPTLGLIVERDIKETRARVSYHLNITAAERKRNRSEFGDYSCAIWWLYFIATADIEHILRRDSETGTKRPVEMLIKSVWDEAGGEEIVDEFLSNGNLTIMGQRISARAGRQGEEEPGTEYYENAASR